MSVSVPNPIKAEDVVREFIQDVEAVGVLTVRKEWPDLILTYQRAKACLKEKSESQRHTVHSRTFNSGAVRWHVYDERMQIEVFHWFGEEGEARCESVAAALNSLGWDA